jgi:hypothetical protein
MLYSVLAAIVLAGLSVPAGVVLFFAAKDKVSQYRKEGPDRPFTICYGVSP